MADIRFGTADITWIFGGLCAEQSAEGLGFHGIFNHHTAAVSFQVTDRFRLGARILQCLPDRLHVGILVRLSGFNPTSGRGPNALNDGMNIITILLGIIQAFQYQGCGPLAYHRAIRIPVKGFGNPRL